MIYLTISLPRTERGRVWLRNVLDGLSRDNTYIVKRPGFTEISKFVIPAVRKAYRTTKLPTNLIKIEEEFWRKVEWPRSVYKYSVFKANIKPYTEISNGECNYLKLIDNYDHCWRPSSKYVWQPDLIRNKRAMSKAAGFPDGGKKREALQGAIQYNTSVVAPSASLDKCWSIVPGYRTQQSESGAEKVRLVWCIPCHIWYLECLAFDDSITSTIAESNKLSHKIQVLYFDARLHLKEWFLKFSKDVMTWVYVDSTQYDSSVQQCEIASVWHYLAPGFELTTLLADYAAKADLVMPEGIVHRNGGMPSGSKGTNMGDGISNVGDTLEVLDRMGLLKYVVCILVNGDDITIGFSTVITEENLKKWAVYTRRRVSADKSLILPDALWNSKWYCDEHITTRPIARALNSLMFKERESSALTANAVYVSIARHQILLDVEQHPCFEVLATELAKYEEKSWGDIKSDPRFEETVEYYISSHDYMGDTAAAEFIQQIEGSRYAKEYGK